MIMRLTLQLNSRCCAYIFNKLSSQTFNCQANKMIYNSSLQCKSSFHVLNQTLQCSILGEGIIRERKCMNQTHSTVFMKDHSISDNQLGHLTFKSVKTERLCSLWTRKIRHKTTTLSRPLNASSTTSLLIKIMPEYCIKLTFQKPYTTDGKQVKDDVESWEMLVDYDKLSPMEVRIHERHRDAVKVRAIKG